MIYFCCHENRRRLVRDLQPSGGVEPLNGLDYLEVGGAKIPGDDLRQRVLRLFFVRPPAGPLLTRLQLTPPSVGVVVTGGERTTGIAAQKVAFDAASGSLIVTVNQRGDFSPYTLALVEPNSGELLKELDPQLAAVDFSFKVDCPGDFDCRTETVCAPAPQPAPEFDYLAQDYASFRQLLLDRLAALLPGWTERNPADLGLTLVEMLAYVGDHLSYRKDAIGTEAYLGTARQRISVRRHTRLLDYAMHDGCNARVWVQVRLRAGAPAGVVLPRVMIWNAAKSLWLAGTEPVPAAGVETQIHRTQFATRMTSDAVLAADPWAKLVAAQKPEIFEPLHDAVLYFEHNQINFYAWGDTQCCLPKGATKAALAGHFPNLQPGDVLIFQEELGPKTGLAADADLTRRHAVRLTKVNGLDAAQYAKAKADGSFPKLVDPITPDGTPQDYTTLEWAVGDALPFPFCLSSLTAAGEPLAGVSVALGNLVLADHGRTITQPESLGAVPSPNPVLAPVAAAGCGACEAKTPAFTPPRFQPRLKYGSLTQAATRTRTLALTASSTPLPFDPSAPAATVFDWDLEHVLPALRLGDSSGELWLPQRDLLSSDAFAPEFVAEVDNDGRANVRFGDDVNGLRPGDGTEFWALYRVGNGARGNVGAEALAHVTTDASLAPASWIESVTNPLPARGGREPETLEQARQYAPAAFREQRRAVTPADYARRAEQHPEVQRAVAELRWTGSWHTVFIAVDRLGGRAVDDAFKEELVAFLEPYRMAGQDLEIVRPQTVALAAEFKVCVRPDYFASDVEAVLREVFTSGWRANGARGFFHPDNFSFGDGVYLSRIYAAAQGVAGVAHLEVTLLRRLGTVTPLVPASSVLAIGASEIARLDNDRNFPDRGVLRFTMKGGR